MSKTISIGDVTIPLGDFAVAGTAWLGIKKAGKTYGAKGVAEQLIEHGVPLIVFDAIGLWRFLKTPGDGHDSKGYKVVVAGGEEPDIPLTAQNASEIIRAAMRSNVSLVIDLYDPKLSKADWRKIVQAGFHTLLYENKQHGPRYIILEEAAEYVPQKVYDGDTYAAVEKMVRMGGNVGLGVALLNPRSQELNKAVLDLCDNLVLLRQRGNAAIDAVQKWMDKVNPEIADEITASLPKISCGECWVWAENSDTPVYTKTHKLHSFHPDRTKHGENVKTRNSVDTAEFVSTLLAELPKVVEEKKANDPAELKRKIRELEHQIKHVVKDKVPDPIVEKVPVFDDDCRKLLEKVEKACSECIEESHARSIAFQEITKQLNMMRGDILGRLKTSLAGARIPAGNLPVSRMVKHAHNRLPIRPAGDVSNGDGNLSGGRKAVLIAAAQHPDGVTDEQIAVLTGYKKTSRTTFKQQLMSQGLLTQGGLGFVATEEGIKALGRDYEPLPTGVQLREHWLQRLSGGEKGVFEIVLQQYPNPIAKTVIEDQTNYKSTSVNTFCQKLSARQLITASRAGVRAADNLFE